MDDRTITRNFRQALECRAKPFDLSNSKSSTTRKPIAEKSNGCASQDHDDQYASISFAYEKTLK